MAEVESAEEFASTVLAVTHGSGIWGKRLMRVISVRDTAIREAAKLEGKRELLAEIRAYAAACPGTGDKRYGHLLNFLELRYQSADSRPAQDGER